MMRFPNNKINTTNFAMPFPARAPCCCCWRGPRGGDVALLPPAPLLPWLLPSVLVDGWAAADPSAAPAPAADGGAMLSVRFRIIVGCVMGSMGVDDEGQHPERQQAHSVCHHAGT